MSICKGKVTFVLCPLNSVAIQAACTALPRWQEEKVPVKHPGYVQRNVQLKRPGPR